jgi:phosphohistidine phosphatase
MTDQSQRPAHHFRQSAALPFRIGPCGVEVLLVTSRRGGRWILPKGIVEPGQSADRSAAREAYEEAGLTGQVDGRPIGSYRCEKWGGVCTVEVFPMRVAEVLADWPERNERSRRWHGWEDAAAVAGDPGVAAVIRLLPAFLDGG